MLRSISSSRQFLLLETLARVDSGYCRPLMLPFWKSSEMLCCSVLRIYGSQAFHTSFCQRQLKQKANERHRSLVEAKDKPFSELTFGEKVKQAGSDATYTGIVIAGNAVTGIMFYAIGRELFSGQSPSGIYSRAFKLCKKHQKIIESFGEPLKAYGEMTSRGRRRHVRHGVFEESGIKHIRLQFYIEGPHNKGTVHVEAKQDDRGKYQFEYILVELDKYPHWTIVVEDNR